ncbi:hypothetical protein ACTHGU_18080 [Chitinophagaceae bacterium MMS25-I14]
MKNLYFFSIIAIAIITLTSCNKSKQQVKPPLSHFARTATWSGTYNGHVVQVTYVVGEEEVITYYVGSIVLHTSKTGNCWGEYGFCKPISLKYNSPTVGADGNGRKIFSNLEFSSESLSFPGFIGLSADGQNIVFATDRTKISEYVNGTHFSSDYVSVPYPFLLDDMTKEALGLNYIHPVVPVGNYELNIDGNIIWWEVPVSSLIEPEVQD